MATFSKHWLASFASLLMPALMGCSSNSGSDDDAENGSKTMGLIFSCEHVSKSGDGTTLSCSEYYGEMDPNMADAIRAGCSVSNRMILDTPCPALEMKGKCRLPNMVYGQSDFWEVKCLYGSGGSEHCVEDGGMFTEVSE